MAQAVNGSAYVGAEASNKHIIRQLWFFLLYLPDIGADAISFS